MVLGRVVPLTFSQLPDVSTGDGRATGCLDRLGDFFMGVFSSTARADCREKLVEFRCQRACVGRFRLGQLSPFLVLYGVSYRREFRRSTSGSLVNVNCGCKNRHRGFTTVDRCRRGANDGTVHPTGVDEWGMNLQLSWAGGGFGHRGTPEPPAG